MRCLMLHMTGFFQKGSQSGMNVFFKVRASSVKKLQIVLGMILLSVTFDQELGRTQGPFRALWEFLFNGCPELIRPKGHIFF